MQPLLLFVSQGKQKLRSHHLTVMADFSCRYHTDHRPLLWPLRERELKAKSVLKTRHVQLEIPVRSFVDLCHDMKEGE